MIKIIKGLIILAALISMMSCGKSDLALDCSSPMSFVKSTTEMLKYLSEKGSAEEQEAFSMGMFKITMEFNKNGEEVEILQQYEGWTMDQVMEHGRQKT